MLKNITLMLASVAVCLLLGEIFVRNIVEPGDFLTPILTKHPQFLTMIAPNSAGEDRWGFRNARVPGKAALVTIGDSMTYGYLAARRDNWPSVVGRETGLTVYNVSMGGWGPSQYLCAMKTYVPRLKPKIIIIGFYLGNDVEQATDAKHPCIETDPDRIVSGSQIVERSSKRPLQGVREWLARHSVLYGMVKASLNNLPLFSKWSVVGQKNMFVVSSGATTVALGISTIDDAQFRKGTMDTIGWIQKLLQQCNMIAAKCYTVLIPSKRSLYYPFVKDFVPAKIAGALKKSSLNEHFAVATIMGAFADSDMTVIDATRDLQNAVRSGVNIYPVSADPHFNANGYHVLASCIINHIKSQD
jgi:hypothetical protein